MSSFAAAIAQCVAVRLVRFAALRRIAPATVLDYGDGLAIVAAEPRRRGSWLEHDLLYLSGEEYRGSRHTATLVLHRALDLYNRNRRDEISVMLSAHW